MRSGDASCNDAIAALLRAELDSPTESARLRAALVQLHVDEHLVAEPDVGNSRENSTRWAVFGAYRGRETLFETLDMRALQWRWELFGELELRTRVVTCRHHSEREFATRDPGRIADVLNSNARPNGVLDRLRNGEVLEPPLLVSLPRCERLVILEGHNPVLSYLRDVSVPVFPISVLVGVSDEVSRWREW